MFRLISLSAGYTGLIVAVLLAFGGLPAEADTLYPTKHTTPAANSDPAGALEAGQESTDLNLEPMAVDDAERDGSSRRRRQPHHARWYRVGPSVWTLAV